MEPQCLNRLESCAHRRQFPDTDGVCRNLMKDGVSSARPIVRGSHLYATAFPDVISHTLSHWSAGTRVVGPRRQLFLPSYLASGWGRTKDTSKEDDKTETKGILVWPGFPPPRVSLPPACVSLRGHRCDFCKRLPSLHPIALVSKISGLC